MTNLNGVSVNSVSFLSDSRLFITGGSDGTIRLFDLRVPDFFTELLDPT